MTTAVLVIALVIPLAVAVGAVLLFRRPGADLIDLRESDDLDRVFSESERRDIEARLARAHDEEMATGRPRLVRFLQALQARRVRVLGVQRESFAHVLSLSDGSTLVLPENTDSNLVLLLGQRAAREQVFLVAATHDEGGFRLYFAMPDGLIPVDVPVLSVI